MTDYKNLPTPPTCVADFCLIPIGTPSASVSAEVASVQRLMAASGLTYHMHSAGTTVEGSWDAVMRLIGQAHTLVHQNGVVRVQTDIRAGTRTDKLQHFSDKVAKVEALLAAGPPDGSAAGAAAAPGGKAEGKETTGAPDVEGNEGFSASQVATAAPKKEAHKGTWASILK